MDAILQEQKEAFARSRAEQAAVARPLSFGKVVFAVILANLLTALLGAMAYQLLRMF